MRAPAAAIAVLVLAALVFPVPRAAAQDFAAVGYVNKLLNITAAPQMAPGESGSFEFQFRSRYPAGMALYNVRLNASIYEYATIDGSQRVDGSWPYPYPKIAETGGREWWWNGTAPIDPGVDTNLSFTIVTVADSDLMPHGSIFAQASYFLRFWLEFDGNVSGNLTHFRLASRGFFTDAQWDAARDENNTNPCDPPLCRGNLNLTYLGVDGVLPDSAFGVLEPIPRWPFYLLIGLAGFFLVMAFLFWVEENPGAYPKVEAWWAQTRGRLRRLAPARRRPQVAGVTGKAADPKTKG